MEYWIKTQHSNIPTLHHSNAAFLKGGTNHER